MGCEGKMGEDEEFFLLESSIRMVEGLRKAQHPLRENV
jgi:hypothetical protein